MLSLKQLLCVVLCVSSANVLATVRVVDFDLDANLNRIQNGQVIDDEYADWGILISSCNTNGVAAAGTDRVTGVCNDDPNAANPDYSNRQAAFNTQANNTQDPDLEFDKINGSWVGSISGDEYDQLTDYKSYYADIKAQAGTGGGLWSRPGNALILNEQPCNATSCTNPDDEGTRPGGFFVFDFTDGPVDILNLDFFDVEGVERTDTTSPQNLIYFFYADGTSGSTQVLAPGNNEYARKDFVSTELASLYTNVTKLVVNLPGSGAINNLIVKATEVPGPAGIALFLSAGVILLRRRKSK